MTELDQVLSEQSPPSYKGQVIKGLPCDCCSRKHTTLKAILVDSQLIWEITSPCLREIVKKACGFLG